MAEMPLGSYAAPAVPRFRGVSTLEALQSLALPTVGLSTLSRLFLTTGSQADKPLCRAEATPRHVLSQRMLLCECSTYCYMYRSPGWAGDESRRVKIGDHSPLFLFLARQTGAGPMHVSRRRRLRQLKMIFSPPSTPLFSLSLFLLALGQLASANASAGGSGQKIFAHQRQDGTTVTKARGRAPSLRLNVVSVPFTKAPTATQVVYCPGHPGSGAEVEGSAVLALQD